MFIATLHTRSLIAAAVVAAVPAVSSAQTFRANDPVLRQMWTQGMDQSRAASFAQVLMDSIGPRLSGSPGYAAAGDWLERVYRDLGITVRREQYGTWRGWQQGAVHVDLLAPRVQTLDAKLLAWSPGTTRAVEGEVVAIPPFGSADEATRWLGTIRGKIVLASVAEPSPHLRAPSAAPVPREPSPAAGPSSVAVRPPRPGERAPARHGYRSH